MVDRKKKMRLDLLMVEKGVVASREKAKVLIMAGEVMVNGETVTKPSKQFPTDVKIHLKERLKYVSRGGYKIEGAFENFKLSVKGKVVCDLGSSTGGFVDFLIKNGAKRVYAVDVGKGQLHWKLRNDSRVIVKEGINARYLKVDDLGEKVDFLTCDLSFISVKKVLNVVYDVLKDDGKALILIKPQFEALRSEVKKGVVRDERVHIRVLKEVKEEAKKKGFGVKGFTFSKLRGPKGNIEFFILLEKGAAEGFTDDFTDIENVVKEAWNFFKNDEGRKC